MPRPDTITAEDLARWDARLDESPLWAGLNADMMGRERVWYTGEWLGEELQRRGCPEKMAHQICFAHGQRQAAAWMNNDRRDPWEIACDCLARFDRGDADRLGPALAVRLFTGEETP